MTQINETYNFTDLLESVSEIEGIRRIRFVSPHPINFSDELVKLIEEKENICNQVHLPLQSGSNAVLKKMRRLHTREWYLELVEKFQACQSPHRPFHRYYYRISRGIRPGF